MVTIVATVEGGRLSKKKHIFSLDQHLTFHKCLLQLEAERLEILVGDR